MLYFTDYLLPVDRLRIGKNCDVFEGSPKRLQVVAIGVDHGQQVHQGGRFYLRNCGLERLPGHPKT